MPNLDPGRQIAVVPMGAFDDDPGARPQAHIWVGSKAAWGEITDDLPRFDGPPQAPFALPSAAPDTPKPKREPTP
jgi:hypothetical protein